MNRGARRAPIFNKDGDCIKFLSILEDIVIRHALEVHAYSLMPNHYHLLVRTPLGNLSQCMRHLGGAYTLWLNKVHQWDGPVFRGRFTSQLVEDEAYLRYLIAYIHLNPLKDHLVPRLDSHAWTSHRAYTGRDSVPEWLTVDQMLEIFGGSTELDKFVRSVRTNKVEYPEDFNPDTGLFGKKAIKPMSARDVRRAGVEQGPIHKRPPADVLTEVTKITGESFDRLMERDMGPRANPARRFAAWALQRGANMTYRQIARALDMPHSQVANLLSRIRLGETKPPLEDWIGDWLAGE